MNIRIAHMSYIHHITPVNSYTSEYFMPLSFKRKRQTLAFSDINYAPAKHKQPQDMFKQWGEGYRNIFFVGCLSLF